MSRIGKRAIPLPDKVTVTIEGQTVAVKGPKGELSRVLPSGVFVEQEEKTLKVNRVNDSRTARERHGLCRTLVSNMVEGVSQGYTRRLEIQGVGYRAAVQGQKLVLSMGYSHPVEMDPPRVFSLRWKTTPTSLLRVLIKNWSAIRRLEFGQCAPPNPTRAKGFATLVSRLDVRRVRPGRNRL